MSLTPKPELLTEAAGVKIYRTPLFDEEHVSVNPSVAGKICVTLENLKAAKLYGKSCGFHLTKSKWDPYPWVGHVETDSLASAAGLKAGDCLVSINGKDLIGLKVKEIATMVHNCEQNLKLLVWRCANEEEQKETGTAIKGPLPDVANKLVNAVSGVVQALECPICLESSMPPVSQCVHGHIICVGCRPRTSRCPICRVRLGQGRCLLADKLHKIFREAFTIRDSSHGDPKYQGWSLRDQLFGRNKKQTVVSLKTENNGVLPKARQSLLSKLFLGGLEKAASADNLTTTSKVTSSTNEVPISSLDFDERLNLNDRTKSASTGELSKEMSNVLGDHLQSDTSSKTMLSTADSLSSVPPASIWGDSMDSVSCVQIICPLSKQTGCRDIIASDTVLEHLSSTHDVPQVHFYSVHVRIPLPLPFGSEAVYVLHRGGDLFFFQCEEETAWIACATGGKNSWEWSLHGRGENGAEIKVRRSVTSLESSMILLPQHLAPLPNTLLLNTLDIQLLECDSQEQLEV